MSFSMITFFFRPYGCVARDVFISHLKLCIIFSHHILFNYKLLELTT